MTGNLPGASRQWDPLYSQIDGMYEYKESGLLCLPCMTEPLMDQMFNDFKFRDGDILIASYPQSGFLWVQEALWHAHNMDTLAVPIKDKSPLCIRLPFLEHEFRNVEPMSLLKDMESPRIMKTHLEYKHLQKQMEGFEDKIKIILWVQDPRKVLKNYHKFWSVCGAGFGFPLVSWEKFFQLFKDKQLFEGDWFEMNRSWIDTFSARGNLLVLTYEDVVNDLDGTVQKLAEFTDVPDWDKKLFKLQKCTYMQPYDKKPDTEGYTEEQLQIVKDMINAKMGGTGLDKLYG
ncbi:hypothetical protein CAPTEDRAFT_219198 [Capitella teleta]|uniref:Sulfotransferase domain-containing protein n=1 Tax=Capitella teleta TaxID=283909 RepID=R7TZB4_CAPTE|nr:hypothetical protein CAPTEDRAFT_219198 [Capitella teleta]|eukprot:ELT98967.1 hypothetical protein CAPTEDRAFT_219198 [Capitella teleta]